jgi:chromosome segregation ATPase
MSWILVELIITLIAAAVCLYFWLDARKVMRRTFASNADVMERLKQIAQTDATMYSRYNQVCAERDKWVNAEAAAVSAHVAMGAELVDAKQQIARLTHELSLTQQHAANRGETILAMERERDSLCAGNKEIAARNAKLSQQLKQAEESIASLEERANRSEESSREWMRLYTTEVLDRGGELVDGLSEKERGRE